MSQPLQLTLNSTLADLPSHHYRVSSDVWGQIIAEELYQNPDLPGVLVIDDSQLIGMISRAKFCEQMQFPEREKIYARSPIQTLLDFIRIPPLLLPKETLISEASQLAINRPRNLIYEPIVILGEGGELLVLDFQVLCRAQTQILQNSDRTLRQLNQTRQKQLDFLMQEKRRLHVASQQLKIEQKIAKKIYHDRYQKKESAVARHYQEMFQLYQELVRETQLVSMESHRAFQAIFGDTDAIDHNSEQLDAIVREISRDSETIASASGVIGEIVQKVRYLAVQASVLTYQSGDTNQIVLSQINVEMNRLVKQTLDVSQQMNKVSGHFKRHVQSLKDMARHETRVSRQIALNGRRVERAIAELERLIECQDASLIALLKKQSTSNEPAAQDLLDRDMAGMDIRFDTSGDGRPNSDSDHLIEMIEKSLKHQPNRT